jgi:hypothetical protein
LTKYIFISTICSEENVLWERSMTFREEMIERFKVSTLQKLSGLTIKNGTVTAETWNYFEREMLDLCQHTWLCLSEEEIQHTLTRRLLALGYGAEQFLLILEQLRNWPEENDAPLALCECPCIFEA